MKKLWKLVAAGLLVCSLGACNKKEEEKETAGKAEAIAVVDTFWTALEEGDIDTARKNVTGDADESLSELVTSMEEMTELFSSFDLPASFQDSVDAFKAKVYGLSFGGHTVDSAEYVSDTSYKVYSTVKIINKDMVSDALASDGENTDFYSLATEYGQEHSDSETLEYIFSLMMDSVSEKIEQIKNTDIYDEQNAAFVVNLIGNQWIIADFSCE